MHRSPHTIIGIFIALSLGLLIVRARVFDALMYFLFAGIIPGTSYALPPGIMLLLTVGIGGVIVARISSYLVDTVQISHEAHKILAHTQRLPRRRYQRG